MSSLCRLVAKPTCFSGAYRKGIVYISKMFPYHGLKVNYSSNACGSGKSGKSDQSGSKCPGSGSENKGNEGGNDPCQPWSCVHCPPPEDNPNKPTMYDLRKYGHCLPKNNVNMCFEPLPHISTGVFRNTDNEVLGLGAGKCCMYKNPEYFSFHHMTYYDMHLIMRCFRKPSPKTGRKP